MSSVFINYRRRDEPWVAIWLRNELTKRLGVEQVFLDTCSIPAGTHYPPQLLAKVRSCVVLVVVIGPRWYERDPDGRLIDDPEDWVRREITTAFEARAQVLPVLVGDVATLVPEDLPPEIRRLARLQYLRVRPEDATRDMPRVVNEILAVESRLAKPESTTREDIDRLVRENLLPVQQRLGDHRFLADVAWEVLLPDERARFVAPCWSDVLLVTDRRICIAELDCEPRGRQVLRFPLDEIVRTEVHRRWRAGFVPTADLIFNTTGSSRSRVLVRSLFPVQAEKVVELLAGNPLRATRGQVG